MRDHEPLQNILHEMVSLATKDSTTRGNLEPLHGLPSTFHLTSLKKKIGKSDHAFTRNKEPRDMANLS